MIFLRADCVYNLKDAEGFKSEWHQGISSYRTSKGQIAVISPRANIKQVLVYFQISEEIWFYLGTCSNQWEAPLLKNLKRVI